MNEKDNHTSLDDLDMQILQLLQRDSRTQYRDLAKITGKSLGTISNRINRLQEIGVIKNWTINIDPESVGIDLTTIINISVDVKHLDKINEKLHLIPELVAIYNITGANDVMAIGRFYNRRHLDRTIHRIINIPHISKTSSHIVLRTLKEDLFLDFPEINK